MTMRPREEVTLLDSDDDVLFDQIDEPPLRDSSSSSSSSSPSSSSPSSSSSQSSPLSDSKAETRESDIELPTYNITDSSVHQFGSYKALQTFMDAHAERIGFEVRWRPTGGESSPNHGGKVLCWCHGCPPVVVKEEVIPSVPPLRKVHATTSRRGGKQIKCGCEWTVSFFRQGDGKYNITLKDCVLVHTGHSLLALNAITSELDSLRNVPEALVEELRGLLRAGNHGQEANRRFLEDRFKVKIDRDVFHNLVKLIKG